MNIAEAVVRIARRNPDLVAVEDGVNRLTYAQLVQQAQSAAHELSRLVPPGSFVPLMVPRGTNFVAAALAVMFAGCAYVPIDPMLPKIRCQTMLTELESPFVITGPQLPDLNGLAQGVPFDALLTSRSAPQNLQLNPDRPAYMIYTSGSSGVPKGVVVAHDSLWNLVSWHNRTYAVGPGRRALQTAGLSFDAAVWEIWPYLCAGATIVVAPDEVRSFPSRLVEYARSSMISILFVSTPLAEEILAIDDERSMPWDVLLTGGDTLHVSRLPQRWKLVNHYGPTEATVVTTFAPVSELPEDGLPAIGRPIAGMDVLICDEAGQPLSDGKVGEIVIGGSGVALGYYRRDELTAARFVTLPNRPGRWYRSGDLGQRGADGMLSYQGRVNDEQLKVRGARVEASEIEAALLRHPRVRHAAVATVGDSSASRSLGAMLVVEGSVPSVSELRKFLLEHLPPNLVPTKVIITDRLPLTSNGKIDRREVSRRIATETTSHKGMSNANT